MADDKKNLSREEKIKRVTEELREKNKEIIARRKCEGFGVPEHEKTDAQKRYAAEIKKKQDKEQKRILMLANVKVVIVLVSIPFVFVIAWMQFADWLNRQSWQSRDLSPVKGKSGFCATEARNLEERRLINGICK